MKKPEALFLGLSAIALLYAFHLIFSGFFPNAQGYLGHDYALFLPKLLDGYFWFHTNGLAAVSWFTPAFCGGIPVLPDPQSIYYSVPQFMSFVTSPLVAVYLTLLLFALVGYLGFYALLRYRFGTTPSTAFLAGGLFLFNGFYVHRMIIGHLTYHAFMLVPLIAYLTLRQVPERGKGLVTPAVVCAGVLMAYMFQAGMVNVILPAIGSVLVIGLIHAVVTKHTTHFGLRLVVAGILACLLSLAKLTAAIAYMQHFGRDTYRLPGATSLIALVDLVFRSLFIAPSHEAARDVLVNVQWLLDRHEFEFGVTCVPLGLMLIWMLTALCRKNALTVWRRLTLAQCLQLGAIMALLFLPLGLNIYTPAWNALLKQIPILKNSTSLIRWFSMYIPVVILLAALAIERTPTLRYARRYVALGSMLVVLALSVVTNRDYYQHESYDPSAIVNTYQRVQTGAWRPVIQHITVYTNAQGGLVMPPSRNNVLTQGNSQLLCYEPLFGYRLEDFPIKTLRPGLVLARHDGYLNLKNPACYVFPMRNNCAPGDHFSTAQQDAANAFVHYQPFAFALPVWQTAANLLNLFALIAMLGYLLFYIPIRTWTGKR